MATFKMAGEPYEFLTASSLTFAEGRAFEKATGFPVALTSLDKSLAFSAASEQALLWLSIKRVKPEMKYEDLDALPMGDIEWPDAENEPDADSAGVEDVTPDPTPADD